MLELCLNLGMYLALLNKMLIKKQAELSQLLKRAKSISAKKTARLQQPALVAA